MQAANGEMTQLWAERQLRHKAEQIATYEDLVSEQDHPDDEARTARQHHPFRVEWRSRAHTIVIAFADHRSAEEADLATHATLLRPLRATGELVLVEQQTERVAARHPLRPNVGLPIPVAA
jgi:hypothetical protein